MGALNMEIIVHIPEADKLAQAIALLAAALGDKSAAALRHPDEDPKPVTPATPATPLRNYGQPNVDPPQLTAAPVSTAVPTAAPAQPTPIQQPQQTAPVTQPTQPLPTTAKQYSFDDLARAAGQLMDAGKQNDLINLLNNQFKVPALTQLPPEQFGAFATALRGLGAQL
jgi:hypothetical protein